MYYYYSATPAFLSLPMSLPKVLPYTSAHTHALTIPHTRYQRIIKVHPPLIFTHIRPYTPTQETERLVADPAPGITAAPHDDNLRYFDVTIQGPDGSPFQRLSLNPLSQPSHSSLPHLRGCLSPGALLTRRVSNEPTQS